MNIVCIGDSLTYGYGVASNMGWVSILGHDEGHTLVNKGIPGNTTDEMVQRFYDDVIVHAPKYAMILGGTNNLFLKKTNHEIILNLSKMIAISKSEGVTPILLTPMAVNQDIVKKTWFQDIDYSEMNVRLSSLRCEILQLCCSENIVCIDLNLLVGDLTSHYLDDGIHIDSLAHEKIAKVLASSLLDKLIS